MDLDQWISKVKDGQHLLEDELQLLCEYVLFFLRFLAVTPKPPLAQPLFILPLFLFIKQESDYAFCSHRIFDPSLCSSHGFLPFSWDFIEETKFLMLSLLLNFVLCLEIFFFFHSFALCLPSFGMVFSKFNCNLCSLNKSLSHY